MTNYAPTSNVTANAAPVYSLLTGDNVYITQGVTISSPDNTAIVGSTQNSITCNGVIIGAVGVSAGFSSTLGVAKSGQIFGFTSGVVTTGDGNALFNDGSIGGGAIGISEVNHVFGELHNTGTIAAGLTRAGGINAGIYISASNGVDSLTQNSGTVTTSLAGAYAILSDGNTNDTLINTGTLIGNVSLGAGNDTFNTAGGRVRGLIDAGDGSDSVTGSAAADAILGGAGSDVLRGLGGNDRITGGDGRDYLYGGTGADQFIFLDTGDSTVGSAGRDSILDFRHSQHDRLNLQAIDADTRHGGNQAFDFIGTHAFTGHAGELRYVHAGSNTYVYGDTNGDRQADFAVHLRAVPSLVAGDFLL